MKPELGPDQAGSAKLLLLLLAVVWGLHWPFNRFALEEVSVWTLRAVGYVLGTALLFAALTLRGRSAAIPPGVDRRHVLVASLFNVIGFGLFSAFAQLSAATSRVVIVNYSMPIWASLMAWLVLRERLTAGAKIGLVLCVAGLTTLIYPVAAMQSASGLLLALGCALCWAAGAVYMKWARIRGDLLAITAWQVAVGAVVMIPAYFVFQGMPALTPVSLRASLAVLYSGLFGAGVGYILWFAIIERLPTATAALGTLTTPIIGVTSSMVLLSEHPTMPDVIGFALIFAAAACVLLQPASRRVKAPS